jgi:TnpA family transposase
VPVQFLSEAERARLSRFPADIPPDDLVMYFTLSDSDLARVHTHRGNANRLGFALQLGGLRYLGYCPDVLTSAPPALVAYVAQQLGIGVEALATYGMRAHTRTDHQQEIQAYLHFREAGPADLNALAAWLVERALEHDRPTLLFQLAAEKLKADKIVRPGVTRLERIVASARERAVVETYHRLAPLLTVEQQQDLDALLIPDEQTGRTPLTWLRHGATATTARAILREIEKLTYLRHRGVDHWDVNALTPNRLKFLAQVARKAINQALQRAPADRRYPILVAFLRQSLGEITDEIVDLFDRCLAQSYNRAGHDLDEFRRRAARATNEKALLFRDLAHIVLDPTVADGNVRARIYERVPLEQLRAEAEEADKLSRPIDDTYFDFLAQRYSYLREFAPALLDALVFHSTRRDDPLLQAVALVRQLNRERRRRVPDHAPLGFVTPKWEAYVLDHAGRINRRYYELCLLWELRHAVRAGDVWIEGSRRYANPASYLIPEHHWPALRPEACRLMHAPEDGHVRIRQRQTELEERLTALDQRLGNTTAVRILNGELVVSALSAEDIPESSKRLQQLVTERLPRIDLTDLLIEVDSWTHFSQHFDHAGGNEPRSTDLLTHLYAAILAQACNFGLTGMAASADLSYRRLAWCTSWYLREETLRGAVTSLVNYHYHQPISHVWGGGTLSSSDGQRFPVAVPSRNATALPRYFGYGRGVTFYSWTSDQFSQYGSKVIPATVRDATYVLDELLDNETELPIAEHATDTSGYTEVIFALFDVLGLQFAPRIRDMGDQRLYRIDRTIPYHNLRPVLKGTVRVDRIVERWDDILRLAGSLKLGWVTASLMIGKLQGYPRQNALTRALQEYGRLVKTLFILRYLESPEYRRRINRQLNKGEELHGLRRFLFFANEGQIRRREEAEQANQASCLNLVTNAVIVWNTVYMAAVIDQLQAAGHAIGDADVVHLSPARYEHINPYGKYRFNVDEGLGRHGLRPLRQPDIEAP